MFNDHITATALSRHWDGRVSTSSIIKYCRLGRVPHVRGAQGEFLIPWSWINASGYETATLEVPVQPLDRLRGYALTARRIHVPLKEFGESHIVRGDA